MLGSLVSVSCYEVARPPKKPNWRVCAWAQQSKDTVVGVQPVMLGDARLASDMATKLLDEGIYVIGFSYPVVPKDQARVRVQMSAVHSPEDIDHAVKSFIKVGRELGVLK